MAQDLQNLKKTMGGGHIMVDNPDVNSLGIGEETENQPESADTTADSERANIEGFRKPATTQEQKNQTSEKTPLSEQPRKTISEENEKLGDEMFN